MKRIIFLLMCLWAINTQSQISTPFQPYELNNLYITSGTTNYVGASFTAPGNPSMPDYISGTGNVQLTASQMVDLKPGFDAGNFTNSTGYFDAKIGPIPITDAEVIGSTNVGTQYEKFEIGINLFNNWNLGHGPNNYIDLINGFISNPQNPGDYFIYPAAGGVLDPYDPDQVRIEAIFYNYNTGNEYIREGFYQQTVTANSNTYSFAIDNQFPFRIRFAPPDAGLYEVYISLYINDVLVGTDPYVATFNVNAATNPGLVGIDANYPWRLAFSGPNNDYTNMYIPIGQNICNADPTDPHLGSALNYTYTMYPATWLGLGSINAPNTVTNDASHRAFQKQWDYINDLADHHGNLVRVFMNAQSNGIDHSTQDQYTTGFQNNIPIICDYRQDHSSELDNTLAICESRGIYMQLVLEDTKNYETTYSWGAYNWNNDGLSSNACSPNPVITSDPYFHLLGGYASEPDILEFFTDQNAITYFKKKLFYIAARWGYSPNMAIYDLMNEPDNTGSNSTTNYSTPNPNPSEWGADPTNFQPAFAQWTSTMVNYLHSFYPPHLITIGYGGGPGYNTATWQFSTTPLDNSDDYVDVIESHDYQQAVDENAARVTEQFNFHPTQAYKKPFLFGELGNLISNDLTCAGIVGDMNEDISFHQTEWATSFMGAGCGLYFFDWEQIHWDPNISGPAWCSFSSTLPVVGSNQISHRKNFDALASFYNDPDIISLISSGSWDGVPHYYQSTANYVTYYYFSDTRNGNQIGWFFNTGVSYDNYPSSVLDHSPMPSHYVSSPNQSSSFCSYTYVDPSTLTVANTLDFNGLNWGDTYDISVYNTYTGGLIYANYAIASAGSISLSWPFVVIPNATTTNLYDPQPDYAYTLKYISSHAPKNASDSTIVYLPNDTVYLPMDSVHFIGSIDVKHKNYKFSWNFGNGITSYAAPFPKFIYHVVGNYHAFMHFTDSAGGDKTTVHQTYVVLDSTFKRSTVPNNDIKSTGVTIVPNPTKGTFSVYTLNNQPIQKLEIYDVLGRQCYSALSPKETTFDISNLTAGMYMVKIYSGGKEYNKKLEKE